MRAVVVDEGLPERLTLRDVAPPAPSRGECIVDVAAISLNLGEVRRALKLALSGWRPGWDFAGRVTTAAANGPPVGARVVGFLESGAWAEQVAVAGSALAVIPDGVSFETAATLPVAGLTALYALAKGGLLLGRRVLVTGATGGVGHFAIQLARDAGAHVTALVRRDAGVPQARDAGAHDVIVGEDLAAASAHDKVDLVVDSVGGAVLAGALGLLRDGGICVVIGNSSRGPVPIDASTFIMPGIELHGLYLLKHLRRVPAGEGLARLLQLVHDGRLRAHVGALAPWEDIAAVAGRLNAREIPGKAVLTVARS